MKGTHSNLPSQSISIVLSRNFLILPDLSPLMIPAQQRRMCSTNILYNVQSLQDTEYTVHTITAGYRIHSTYYMVDLCNEYVPTL